MIGRIDHIGVVVDDLGEAMRFCSDTLGFKLTRELDLPARSVKAAFLAAGSVSLELIEVSAPELRRQRLGNGVQARLEHVAIEVDDLAAAARKLRARGVRTTTDEPTITAGVASLWTVPATSDGVSYQLLCRRLSAAADDGRDFG